MVAEVNEKVEKLQYVEAVQGDARLVHFVLEWRPNITWTRIGYCVLLLTPRDCADYRGNQSIFGNTIAWDKYRSLRCCIQPTRSPGGTYRKNAYMEAMNWASPHFQWVRLKWMIKPLLIMFSSLFLHWQTKQSLDRIMFIAGQLGLGAVKRSQWDMFTAGSSMAPYSIKVCAWQAIK